ncbi:MAG: regulatory protein RecX [Gammaproteobacteria bacterium]
MSEEKSVRDIAIGLLARREHSCRELSRKLGARGHASDVVNKVITQLAHEGLQSDQRFTETYLHSRIQKGYGPMRLRQELQERGVDAGLISVCMESLDVDWTDILHSVREKKFGKSMPASFRDKSKEARFLQYRGFSTDQIRRIYNNED